ncbi:response regulator [Actinoplanes sp. NPDC020271]|uniref:response regulator n=1 Tax=Actinoplanes sp. NPDC020271 TaxID=3363896 RepID=UPI00378B5B9C
MQVIRVVVVDDEALVRSGFAAILNAAPGIEVVATATGGEALGVVRAHEPHVVLLDIRMPDVDGLTVLARLRELPEPPVVAMLTTFAADEYVLTALHSGAAGFLLKDTDPVDVAQLVRTLAAGGVVMSRTVSRALHGRLPPGSDPGRVAHLTGPERAVLVLLAGGLSNAGIAERLGLADGTVAGHVSALLAGLRVSSRIQAALVAERAGLLDEQR